MHEFWAVIGGMLVLLVVYFIVSSKLEAHKHRMARAKILPFVDETIRTGQRYHVHLCDGRSYRDVELLGTNDPASGPFVLGGWDGMLVLAQLNGKRAFIRQGSVRCVEEV